MSEPLTAEERLKWRERESHVMLHSNDFTIEREDLAFVSLRYEATLQAKDEQIKRLGAACEALVAYLDEWHSIRKRWVSDDTPEGKELLAAGRLAKAAIKEATE